ncbi:MAG TPA: GAF domain-containing protein [Methanoregulaceae archaeon]|nr:GAF domain-containing protein [Methanoregulaceae archaeon]
MSSSLIQLTSLDLSDLSAFFKKVTENAVEVLNTDRASVWLFDPNTSSLICMYCYGRDSGKCKNDDMIQCIDIGKYLNGLYKYQTFSPDNIQPGDAVQEIFQSGFIPGNIGSLLHVPIRIGGEIKGVFCCEDFMEDRTWNVEEEDFAVSLASTTTLAIEYYERTKVEKALRHSNEKLNLLANITRHDILNELTVITGNLDLAKELGSIEQNEEIFEKIRNATEKIQHQIEFTRLYQEVGVKSPEWQDLGEALNRSAGYFTLDWIHIENGLKGIIVYADPLLEKVMDFSNY